MFGVVANHTIIENPLGSDVCINFHLVVFLLTRGARGRHEGLQKSVCLSVCL